jgi:hypothetical protein
MVALLMASLCLVAAFTVDLGLVRMDRQQNKSAADSATLAGVSALAPPKKAGTFYPFAGVCAALHYLEVNSPSVGSFATSTWTDGNGVASPVDGCDPSLATATCTPNAPSTWARFVGTTSDGRFTVRIQSGYDVSDPSFPEESLPSLQSDTGDAKWGNCDQLAVIVAQTRGTTLGALATSSDGSVIRSVARVTVAPPKDPVSLLVLERHDCQALAITSGGAGGRIEVNGYANLPGIIHVDSDGTGSGCNKPIIDGKNPGTCPDPVTPPHTCGGIVAYGSTDGSKEGIISVSATSNTSDGIPRVFAGPYPGTDPIYRDLVTRSLPDSIYLSGVTQAVQNAQPFFTAAAAGTAPVTTPAFTTVGCNPSSPVSATLVFVKCANFNNAVTFTNATTVIFTGMITANNLRLPKATRVYVVGGTSPAGLANSSGFAMNDGGAGSCPSTVNPAGRAQLFIENGNFTAAGSSSLVMCNTTLIMMGGRTDACVPTTTPTYTSTPCPGVNAGLGNGQLSFSGGATIDWTAPNQISGPAAQIDYNNLEDLALWTESGGTQDVGGGGSMHLAGVFMAPNANPFKIAGGGTQNVAKSEYVVRKLWNPGNGTLSMSSDPDLPLNLPEVVYSLVR